MRFINQKYFILRGMAFLLIMFLFLIGPVGSKFLSAEEIKPPLATYFYIKSVQSGISGNNGYWDQPGTNPKHKNGTNIAVWTLEKYDLNAYDRKYRIVPAGNGYYYIKDVKGSYIDVSGGNNKDGVNIQIWERNKSKAQKLKFKYLGNGRWKIYTYWGRIICLKGKSYKKGTNIHTWKDHSGASTEWYFVNARTKKIYNPKSTSKPKLNAINYNADGRGANVNPGISEIEIWYMDRNDKRNPYKLKRTIKTDSYGSFYLGKDTDNVFLLTKTSGRASSFTTLYKRSKDKNLKNLVSYKYEANRYVLVDTLYRGKQYYYKYNNMYYRKNGKITRRDDFFFPELTKINRNNAAVKNLLSDIGAGSTALTDDEIAKRVEGVFNFLRTKKKSSMGSKDPKVQAAMEYIFRNCRKSTTAPVDRWPSFQEIADTYQKFGFVPAGNCTSNSQLAATLLYAAGVPTDKFFVSKFRYNMSWYVEHWVIALKIGRRWHSLDPQHAKQIKLKSAKDFENPYWEKYLGKTFDYKKPFEAYLLPGSNIKRLPYLGDPSELDSIKPE